MKRVLRHASPKSASVDHRVRRKEIERSQQQQTVAIDRGLFVIRYAAADDEQRPPTIRILPSPAARKNIQLILHPDFDEAILLHPDSCLVVRTAKPGVLAVEVTASHAGGSTAATVRIEPLTQDKGELPVLPASDRVSLPYDSPPGLPQPYDLDDLRILGHVSGTGDILVNAGEWLAGPSAPSRIEGLSITWPGKPTNLNIDYAVKTATPQPTSGRKVGLGAFAGSRGKAMPIIGLMVEMSGADALGFRLFVEAIFLGGPVITLTGKRIVASGPTGREPLVGLRMKLAADDKTTAQDKSGAVSTQNSENRVRVFRSLSRPNYQVPA